jgi:hypothetical protein
LFELEDPQYDETKSIQNGKIFILDRDVNGDNKIDVEDLQYNYLDGGGDFQSDEITRLRDQADIIVTNPPFSLFSEFVAWIISGQKQFAILGNMNAVTYKGIFPLIKENKIWLGVTRTGVGSMWFAVSEDAPEKTGQKFENGQRLQTIGNSMWLTNIDHGRRHEPLNLMTQEDNYKYSKHKEVRGIGYKRYENYDAIEVPFIDAIPSDYDGVMGVPISYLGKHNPEQFEIVGTMASSDPNNPYRTKMYTAQEQKDAFFRRFGVPGNIPLNMSGVIDDVKVFTRIMIRHRKKLA